MYIIRITKKNAEFIGTYLNNGVTPEIEHVPTWFVFEDGDTPPRIIEASEYLSVATGHYDTVGIVIEKF